MTLSQSFHHKEQWALHKKQNVLCYVTRFSTVYLTMCLFGMRIISRKSYLKTIKALQTQEELFGLPSPLAPKRIQIGGTVAGRELLLKINFFFKHKENFSARHGKHLLTKPLLFQLPVNCLLQFEVPDPYSLLTSGCISTSIP